jgi:hypothetical protein
VLIVSHCALDNDKSSVPQKAIRRQTTASSFNIHRSDYGYQQHIDTGSYIKINLTVLQLELQREGWKKFQYVTYTGINPGSVRHLYTIE